VATVLAAVLGLGVFPCCSGRAGTEPVVLEVGPRQVRVGELERAFWAQQKKSRSFQADTTSLRRFLPVYVEDLIEQEIARREIPELTDYPAVRVQDFRERTLVARVREEAYGRAARPTEDRLREAYELLGRQLHLRFLKVTTRASADNIMNALRGGGVFAKIAEHSSEDERSRGRGGDIGWISYYDLDAEVRDRVFSQKPGDLVGPIEWSDHFQIFQVLEERPNPARGTFEAEREQLRHGLSMRGIIEGRKRYIDDLFRKYELRIDPAEVAWMTALLREKTSHVPRDIGGYSPEELEDPEVQGQFTGNPFDTYPIPPADSARVLATFNDAAGRQQKVIPVLMIDQLLSDAPISWPRFEKTSDVEGLIRALVLERLEIWEAEARGLDKDPEVQALIREQADEVRTRFYYRTRLRPQARPDSATVRAYYASHPEEFSEPEKRRFLAINAGTHAVALRARDLLREGKTPTVVKSMLLAEDATVSGTGDQGTPPYANGQSPLLDPYLFKLGLNGVSEPIPVGDRYTVAKVVEIIPAAIKSLEEASPAIVNRETIARADSLFAAQVAQARAEFPVRINEEALQQVRVRRPPD